MEEIGGRPIVLHRGGTEDEEGSYARFSYGRHGKDHEIVVSREAEREADIDHLVAHECGHALRLLSQPVEGQLVPAYGPEQQRRAAEVLEPELRRQPWSMKLDRRGEVGPQGMEDAVAFYHRELSVLLFNYPQDLRIETFLRERFPDLRMKQRAALRRTLDVFQEAKQPSLAFVESVGNALFAGYGVFVSSHLLGAPWLEKPLLKADRSGLAEELAEGVWQTRSHGYGRDKRDVDLWTRKLGLEGWYSWGRLPLSDDGVN